MERDRRGLQVTQVLSPGQARGASGYAGGPSLIYHLDSTIKSGQSYDFWGHLSTCLDQDPLLG